MSFPIVGCSVAIIGSPSAIDAAAISRSISCPLILGILLDDFTCMSHFLCFLLEFNSATISAGPMLFFDKRTCQPINLKYRATMYSASLPNVLIEYVCFNLEIHNMFRSALTVIVKIP
jgi:hypothetical protein